MSKKKDDTIADGDQLETTTKVGGLMVTVEDDTTKGSVDGTETLGREDFTLPRLVLCQSMTPQRKRSEAGKYIPGLDEGMFFDNVNRVVYGEGPLYFGVIRVLGTRHIEFNDPEDGGGVKDFNVPAGDPRTFFTDEVRDGRTVRVKPLATLFYDYLLLLITNEGKREVITLSLKGTQIAIAKTFNLALKTAKFGIFTLQAVPDKRADYTFFNVKIDRVKIGDKGANLPALDQELIAKLRETYKTVTAAQVIKTDDSVDGEVVGSREPGSDDVEF